MTTTDGKGYRYGFNSKEYDNEVYGDVIEQDYGMRTYDPRIGRFFSFDPLAKKYPELTPYQFASDRPIDGIDLDGLEFKKYNPTYTTTIVFPVLRDKSIEEQYNYAMQGAMNVLVSTSLNETVYHLAGKGKVFQTLIFGGHGYWDLTSVSFATPDYYTLGELPEIRPTLVQLGRYVSPKGRIMLLGCFQATPNYEETSVKRGRETFTLQRNSIPLLNFVANATGRAVMANQGETAVRVDGVGHIFDGQTPQGIIRSTPSNQPYANMNNKFAGNWTIITPDGKIRNIGNIKLNSDGSYTPTHQPPPTVPPDIPKPPAPRQAPSSTAGG